MGTLAPILSLFSGIVSAAGSIAAGQAQQRQAQYQAALERQKAQRNVALGQRQAADKNRDSKLRQSQLQARFAGSGFGAGDDSVLALMGREQQRGAYGSELAMYNGLANQQEGEGQARLAEMRGAAAAQSGAMSGFSSILSSFGTFAKG